MISSKTTNLLCKTDQQILTENLTWNIQAKQHVQYDVAVIRNILNLNNPSLAEACGFNKEKKEKRLAIIDDEVNKIYGQKFKEYFDAWNFEIHWKVIKINELVKTLKSATILANEMVKSGLLRRGEVVIGIGGGVLLDLVGFASSLYRRGIPYIKIPTTLMGQIDAGIGIKTGVNHVDFKNRLGTYYPPSSVLIDPIFLKTLSQRHISNGIAEIIKMALIKDKKLFELLEHIIEELTAEYLSTDHHLINEIFYRSIDGMLKELEPNLWETELSRCVDYGHTFSPSLELKASPILLHGEAVAVDMALCLALAYHRSYLTKLEVDRALTLIEKSGLPLTHQIFNISLLEKALADAVKHRDGFQRIPITNGLGKVIFINDFTVDELDNAIQFLEKKSRVFA